MRKRTAQSIEEHKAAVSTPGKGKRSRGIGRGRNPNSRKGLSNLKPFPPGVSGNPSGLPGYDVAAAIARRALEQLEREGNAGMLEQLRKGNAYAFSVLADRGYGKVKDKQQIEVTGAEGGPVEFTVRLVRAADGKSGA